MPGGDRRVDGDSPDGQQWREYLLVDALKQAASAAGVG